MSSQYLIWPPALAGNTGVTSLNTETGDITLLGGTNVTITPSGNGITIDSNQTNITGNAATATALQTARTINGTSFDGTANITVAAAAGTLTGTTLASGIIASSLTSLGTLANLTVTNPISGSVTGSAATVTTNANLTGVVTSVGNATSIANSAITDAMLQTSYLKADGTRALTGNWMTGLFQLGLASTGVDTNSLVQVGGVTQAALSGATQQGLFVSMRGNSNGTTRTLGQAIEYRTAAASYTAGVGAALRLLTPTIGAGSTVTQNTGLLFQGVGAGGANNVFIADNESVSGNFFINSTSVNPTYLGHQVTLGATGNTSSVHAINGQQATPASGVGTFTNLPAGSSGNPTGYLQISINGTIRNIPYW